MHSLYIILFAGLAVAAAGLTAGVADNGIGQAVSKHRMFYNDDGDSSLSGYMGPFRHQILTDIVDVLLGTPVTTLVLCVTPSDCTNYPSKVGSMACWRKTPSHESGYFRQKYDFYQWVRENEIDIPRVVMERAAEKRLEFIPSMRMNDAHFGQKVNPVEHPWTGEFWMKHQNLAIGPADFPEWGNQHLLDFKHQEVRDYKLALAFEIIDRYGQDGFEMDWTRHYTFFKPGSEQPDLITEMVREVRKHLDARAGPDGKRPILVARVTATVEKSTQYGLDVRRWVKEGLVDYLVPSSPSRFLSIDIPVDEWVELVKGTQTEVHVSPDSAAPRGSGQATLQMYRAAASNYYNMGAHGFYVFNLFCQGFPLETEQYMILRDVSDPAALDRRDKMFVGSFEQWRPDQSVLPMKLDISGKHSEVGLYVGDDLAAANADTTLKKATLRVRVDRLEQDDRLEVTLNGAKLDMAQARVHFPDTRETIAFNASIPTWTPERAVLGSNPGVWCEIELKELLPKRGPNTVGVRIVRRASSNVKTDTQLVNVDLLVSYNFCGSVQGVSQ